MKLHDFHHCALRNSYNLGTQFYQFFRRAKKQVFSENYSDGRINTSHTYQ
jgi:hypothetical protein